MRGRRTWSGALVGVLALLSLRCSAGYSVLDAGIPDAAVSEAGADAPTSPNDAAPDAPPLGEGDPRLDRAPAASCYTPLPPAAVNGLFPGYGFDLFKGARGDAGTIASTIGAPFYCPTNGILRLQLSYDPPSASHRPSFGVIREGVPTAMVVEYVLEASTIPDETTDDVLVGPFVRSATSDALLVLAVARRAPTEELDLVRITTKDTVAAPLGVFAYPIRVRLETAPAGGKVKWTVTMQDRAKKVERSGEEVMPASPFGVLFGTTRTAPGGPTLAVFSDVKLP